MKLSFEDIKRVTVGALKVYEEEGAVCFRRCTEWQTEFWYSKSDFLGRGSEATTGVRLDFHTDSATLAFSASKGGYDILIDGLLRCRLDGGEEVCRLDIADPLGAVGGEHRVTLCMPSHGRGRLNRVELDDGAKLSPHTFDRRFLFLGDSITQGWDSGYDSLSYAYQTALRFNAESLNQGIGGSYFAEGGMDDFDFEPDFIFIAWGTNDYEKRASMSEFKAMTGCLLDRVAARYPGRPTFVISPIWRDRLVPRPMGSFADCRRAVAEAAEAHGFIHIDGLGLVPPIPAFFSDEFLHPNAAGFSLYAGNLTAKLSEYIK